MGGITSLPVVAPFTLFPVPMLEFEFLSNLRFLANVVLCSGESFEVEADEEP